MRGRRLTGLAIALVPILLARTAQAQGSDDGVYWHTDPSVTTCSMVIDPSLTQAQWGTFVRQAGAILTFRSLAPAEPVGKGRLTLGIDYSLTSIDQHDPAWINTFTHPDASCPLGDRIELPTVRVTWGFSSRMDVAGVWTTAPGANYGFAGGSLKYAFLKESAHVPAAAVSASAVALTGVPDFDFSVYSLGIMTSKRMAAFTPYVGLRNSLAVGTEETSKVDLARESASVNHGFVGATYSIWKIGVAAEYDVATVNTFDLMIGFRP